MAITKDDFRRIRALRQLGAAAPLEEQQWALDLLAAEGGRLSAIELKEAQRRGLNTHDIKPFEKNVKTFKNRKKST